jgi:hypothetical protein
MEEMWTYKDKEASKLWSLLSESHLQFKKIVGPEVPGLPLHKDRASAMARKIENKLRQ